MMFFVRWGKIFRGRHTAQNGQYHGTIASLCQKLHKIKGPRQKKEKEEEEPIILQLQLLSFESKK